MLRARKASGNSTDADTYRRGQGMNASQGKILSIDS